MVIRGVAAAETAAVLSPNGVVRSEEDEMSPTNIMHAAYIGAFDVVKAMVADGTPADAPDFIQGSTPLHWACFGGHLHIARWLVKKAGADPNRRNHDGCTPVLFACERGHTGVAQWLVREGGAQVNVKDDITWQTPLHRVCFNAQRNSNGATISEDEDLALWLVEAGADLTAMDRFGNHVEDNLAKTDSCAETANVGFSTERFKLGKMIFAAREDGGERGGAKEKLMRRSSARRRSTGDVNVQLSPKLEAKQRAPMSRARGKRSTSNSSDRASNQSPANDPLRLSANNASRRDNGEALRSPHHHSTASITFPNGDCGSGGGVAAPPAGGGARMGGGPPAPAVADGRLANGVGEGGAGYMGEMVALFGGGKHRHESRRSKDISSQRRASVEDEKRHLESIQLADAALAKAGLEQEEARAGWSDKDKAREGEEQVVEMIRDLSLKKAAGVITEEEFAAKKRQILEMEHLRREAEDEARKREQGEVQDVGEGILTSVGQNTPPPSPKAGQSDNESDEDDPMPLSAPSASEKESRETYKASDIDRYTNVKNQKPSVSGPVPESVKESLAAKEAQKDPTGQDQDTDATVTGQDQSEKEPKINQVAKNEDGARPSSAGKSQTKTKSEAGREGSREDSAGRDSANAKRDPAIPPERRGCFCTVM